MEFSAELIVLTVDIDWWEMCVPAGIVILKTKHV